MLSEEVRWNTHREGGGEVVVTEITFDLLSLKKNNRQENDQSSQCFLRSSDTIDCDI